MMVNICSSSFSSSYLVLLIHCEVPISSSVSPWSHISAARRGSRHKSGSVPPTTPLWSWQTLGTSCDRGRDRNGTNWAPKCRGFHPEKWGVCGGPLQYFKLFFLCIHFWGRFAGELRCEKTVLNVDVADHHSHPKLGPKLMMF